MNRETEPSKNPLADFLKEVPGINDEQLVLLGMMTDHKKVVESVKEDDTKRPYALRHFLNDVNALTDSPTIDDRTKPLEAAALDYAYTVVLMDPIAGENLHPQEVLRTIIDARIVESDTQTKGRGPKLLATVNRLFETALGYGMQAQKGNDATKLQWGETVAKRLMLDKPQKVPRRLALAA